MVAKISHKKLILDKISTIISNRLGHSAMAKTLVDLLRIEKQYRWVGLYDVTETEVINIAWSGPSAPAHPRFPVTQGLTSSAVSSGQTVNVGNVNEDSRYLTALGSTQSEIIVPLKNNSNKVIGTLDVESEKLDAFDSKGQAFLEECARFIEKRW